MHCIDLDSALTAESDALEGSWLGNCAETFESNISSSIESRPLAKLECVRVLCEPLRTSRCTSEGCT